MKKLYVLAAAILCGIASNAQSFSDDFESYTVGNFLGSSSSNWTTWSGGSGGADDVKIVNDNSNSGSKSIYFLATAAAGGPDDVVLPFGGTYTTGKFQYNMMMNVASGNGAYFNLQAEETIGVTWAMECYMNQLGNIVLSNTNGTLLTGSYDVGQWFEIGFDVNLNTNSWELFIDSVSQGTFSNSINSVG